MTTQLQPPRELAGFRPSCYLISDVVGIPDRLKYLISVDTLMGCWLWNGRLNRNGYGRIKVDGREVAAHRFVYQCYVDHVPKSRKLDHECRNRACVNPDHMTPRTNRDNTLRGIGPTAKNAAKTECIRGHALPPKKNGRRTCVECQTMRKAGRL